MVRRCLVETPHGRVIWRCVLRLRRYQTVALGRRTTTSGPLRSAPLRGSIGLKLNRGSQQIPRRMQARSRGIENASCIASWDCWRIVACYLNRGNRWVR